MLLVGELVLTRNQIVQNVAKQTDTDLIRSSQRLNLIASELQEGVMKTRMQPIDHIWSKLPRVVRDLGIQCGKSVRLEMEGKDTELDKTLLEAVKDPLTHLVRNSVDHGIEKPDARKAAGKPAEGVLTLRAKHESGQVVVEVADDGAGIDPAKLGAKAVERGLITVAQLDRMSPTDILQLIFLPGFSTAAAVTNVSGRGVGMDVVKTNIEAIGGTIEVESDAGIGTVCRLRIPLTLAIVPALTVECAADRYAIPQISLQELVSLDAEKAVNAVEEVGGAQVYRLRGELLPLVRLTDVLGLTSERHDGHVVIAVLRSEGRRFGLVVDRVINTEEIVVKAVGGQLKAIGLYSGATVLGDGTVALILDVQALARRALRTETVDRQESRSAAAARRGDQRDRAPADAARRHRRRPPRRHPARHRHPARAGARRRGGEGRQPRGRAVPRRDPADRPPRPAPRRLQRERPRGPRGHRLRRPRAQRRHRGRGDPRHRRRRGRRAQRHRRPGSARLRRPRRPGDRAPRRARRDPGRRPGVLQLHPSPRCPRAPPPLCWRSDVTAAIENKAPATSGQLATFRLDGDLYGVEVEHVQEVLRSQQLTRVPLAPSAVAGLINLRGQVVTAIELRERLGRPPRPEGTDAVVIVVRLHGEAVSLLVDSIADVVDVDANDFEAPPDTLEGQARDLIRGAYKLDGKLLLALDVHKAVGA